MKDERRRLQRLHDFENDARARGFRLIGGVDEVGRGPLAGPVIAACVVLDAPLFLPGLDDSKRVRPHLRASLAMEIKTQAVAWALGEASVAEIEEHNIATASALAMERAVAATACPPDYLLVDAFRLASFTGEQLSLIRGDARCAAIAAASIIAKVHRDALLCALDRRYPQYGFAAHKGYGTPRHLAALHAYGPCEHHRQTFAPVRRARDRDSASVAT